MQTEELLTTFTNLVTTDSPSFEEANVASYCEKTLRSLGFTVCFDSSAKQTGVQHRQLDRKLAWYSKRCCCVGGAYGQC